MHMEKGRVWVLNGLQIISSVALIFIAGIGQANQAPSRQLSNGQLPASDLVVSGTVVGRREIWDRRTNPLMGRPDLLKEIILQVNIARVISGSYTSRIMRIDVSIKGQEKLIAFMKVVVGWRGTYYLGGKKSLYDLLDFRDGIAPQSGAPVVNPTQVTQARTIGTFPENVSGQDIKASIDVREKALKEIVKRYGMAGASVVTLTSHQGPMPPEGGYIIWGVKGLISGEGHIWQGGYGLRKGTELEDPHRYQK